MMRGTMLAGWAGAVLAGVALSLSLPPPARAADVKKELDTAVQHAEFAAAAKDVKMAHAHLHHVINCLVGPKGKGFDAKQLDPCKGMGNGAIPDSSAAAQKKELRAALRKAEQGLKESQLATAQKTATDVGELIKKASM